MAINLRELGAARAKATRSGKPVQISDIVPKLYARAYPSGRVVFLHRQNLDKGKRSTTKAIGDLSDQFTIDDARAVARDRNSLASTGVDLRAKEEQEQRRQQAITASTKISQLVDSYLELNSVGKSTGYVKEQRQIFRDYVVPVLGANTLVGVVTVADCQRTYLNLISQNRLHTARKVYTMLKRFFDTMVIHGHIDQSPMKHLRFEQRLRSRRVRLTLEDGMNIWRMSEHLNPVPRAFIRMLILTGQRRTQMASLEHSEIDFDKRIVTVPASKTKNGEPHIFHLSDLAIATLRDLPRPEGKRYVFYTRGDSFYLATNALKKAMVRQLKAHDIVIGPAGDWRLHDLRKLCAVGMRDIGASMDVIERILHHVSHTQAGLLGTYHLGELLPERKQAMCDWSDLIAARLASSANADDGGGNIVSLTRSSSS